MTDREAMQKAFEIIGVLKPDNFVHRELQGEAWDALRQALAQPEQIMTPISPDQYERLCGTCGACTGKPWVGLTDDEIKKIVDLNTSDDGGFDIWCDGIAVASIVCAKLKEKNT